MRRAMSQLTRLPVALLPSTPMANSSPLALKMLPSRWVRVGALRRDLKNEKPLEVLNFSKTTFQLFNILNTNLRNKYTFERLLTSNGNCRFWTWRGC